VQLSWDLRSTDLDQVEEIQRDATVCRYLFTLNYSTCSGRPSCPSSGVHKTVVAASGTDHILYYLGIKLSQSWPRGHVNYAMCFGRLSRPSRVHKTVVAASGDLGIKLSQTWPRGHVNYCTCFGRPSRPSSGVHKTTVAASGTDHILYYLEIKLSQTWPRGHVNYSTCFGRPSRPSSGVLKTVVAASGTDHTIWGGQLASYSVP